MQEQDAKGDAAGVSQGFPPIARADARVLILGSLPGEASIRAQEYYAHPRNAFWTLMKSITGADGDYAARCEALKAQGIAVWDVLSSSVRPGSLDADIELATALPNDFERFFAEHKDIRLVCFNGRKAEAMFRRFVRPEFLPETLKTALLPSTSPAHASRTLAEKLETWRGIIEPGLRRGQDQ